MAWDGRLWGCFSKCPFVLARKLREQWSSPFLHLLPPSGASSEVCGQLPVSFPEALQKGARAAAFGHENMLGVLRRKLESRWTRIRGKRIGELLTKELPTPTLPLAWMFPVLSSRTAVPFGISHCTSNVYLNLLTDFGGLWVFSCWSSACSNRNRNGRRVEETNLSLCPCTGKAGPGSRLF